MCVCLSVCLSHNSSAVNLIHLLSRRHTICVFVCHKTSEIGGDHKCSLLEGAAKSTVTTVDFQDQGRSWMLAFGRCRQNQPSPRLISKIGWPKSTVTTVDFRDWGRSWVLAFGRCGQNQPSPRLISKIEGDHVCSLLEDATEINTVRRAFNSHRTPLPGCRPRDGGVNPNH